MLMRNTNFHCGRLSPTGSRPDMCHAPQILRLRAAPGGRYDGYGADTVAAAAAVGAARTTTPPKPSMAASQAPSSSPLS